jgi:hypothetical protein
VCADREPIGGIHYYLGHDNRDHSDLKIGVDSLVELKLQMSVTIFSTPFFF